MKRIKVALLILAGVTVTAGCYYYVPPAVVTLPGPPYASYDYIWDSAMRAAQDVGIQITSSNRSTGTAFGQRDGIDVTIQVTPQADGRTRVELSAKGTQSGTSAVADDFYQQYNTYMGRR